MFDALLFMLMRGINQQIINMITSSTPVDFVSSCMGAQWNKRSFYADHKVSLCHIATETTPQPPDESSRETQVQYEYK